MTNNDIVAATRYLYEIPPNVTAAINYLKQFTP